MRKSKYARSLEYQGTRNKPEPRFQAQVMWDTPREDSGEKYFAVNTYITLINILMDIFEGNDSKITLSKNPKINLATDNGRDILWKVRDNIDRNISQGSSK